MTFGLREWKIPFPFSGTGMRVANSIPDFRDGNWRPVFPGIPGIGNSRSWLLGRPFFTYPYHQIKIVAIRIQLISTNNDDFFQPATFNNLDHERTYRWICVSLLISALVLTIILGFALILTIIIGFALVLTIIIGFLTTKFTF